MWPDTLLFVGLAVVYLVGNATAPLFDRDEPRYALTSLAMLESGDYVVPRLLGEVRTAKPPATYWLQAAAMSVFGVNAFAVRLPGTMACLAAVALLRYGAAGIVGRRRARWASFFLGTSTLTLGAAKVGVTDGPLLPCAVLVLLGFLHARRGGERAWWLIAIGLGIGGLIKGPVLLGVAVSTAAAAWIFDWRADRERRWLRRLRPMPTFLVAVAINLPWLVAVTLREPGFIGTAFGHDVLGRSARGLEGHGQPPGFHTLLLPATLFPWSLLLIETFVTPRRRPWQFMCLAAIVGPLVMFELIATKLPHYLLPVFPALTLLMGGWAARATAGRRIVPRAGRIVAGVVVFGVCLTVAVGSNALALSSPGWSRVLVVGAGVAAMVAWWGRSMKTALVVTGIAWPLVAIVAFSQWVHRVPPLTLSQRVADAVPLDHGNVGMIEYKEPSLAWYLARRGLAAEEATSRDLAGVRYDQIVITSEAFEAAQERSPEALAAWLVEASVAGRNVNDGGQHREILVLRRSDGR